MAVIDERMVRMCAIGRSSVITGCDSPGQRWYEFAMAVNAGSLDDAAMGKRVLAGVLWLFAGWYLGAFVAYVLGAPDLLGPVLGIASAAFFAGDPLRVIWHRAEAERVAEAPGAAGWITRP